MNVSDLWPLSAVELGAMKDGGVYYRVMSRIERYIYIQSTAYQGQSQEIIDHVKPFAPQKRSFLYRNLQHDFVLPRQDFHPRRPLKIVYAGLLGVAQNILEMVEALNFKEMGVELHLFGGGNQAKAIEEYIAKHDKGVFYHGTLPKEQIRNELIHYHVSIIPLTVRIKGAVPSKLFDLLPLGIPILFSGGGEGERIVEDNKLGFVSAPGNYGQLSENIKRMRDLSEDEYQSIRKNCLDLSRSEFSFDKQLKSYCDFLRLIID